MKKFTTIMVTMILTALFMAGLFVARFGSIDIDTHTDRYETYKNGLLCEVTNDIRVDSVSLDLDLNKEFKLF